MTPISLYQLNSLVNRAFRDLLCDTYWVMAEVSELRVAGNGHCYVEFVEKEEGAGRLLAKARGNIWRDTYNLLAPYFEQETGMPLAAGLKVLVNVTLDFHPLYGYALTVHDIEPSYTLGAVAQRRKQILDQLEKEGVADLNRELELPRLTLRLAIVSSATAAGYGDFCNQLDTSGFAFRHELFSSAMQGDGVEAGIINALNRIAERLDEFDAVAIIRGGGAVSDLNGFESYELAANVAQFPLPVLTGIGHERDETVIDFVAHTRLKTPTAVAAFLIERMMNEASLLENLSARLRVAVERAFRSKQNGFNLLASRYRTAATRYCGNERTRLSLLQSRLLQATSVRLEREKHRLDACRRTIRMASPERILQLGYTLTLSEGKIVGRAAELKAGAQITTRFADGEIHSTINP